MIGEDKFNEMRAFCTFNYIPFSRSRLELLVLVSGTVLKPTLTVLNIRLNKKKKKNIVKIN